MDNNYSLFKKEVLEKIIDEGYIDDSFIKNKNISLNSFNSNINNHFFISEAKIPNDFSRLINKLKIDIIYFPNEIEIMKIRADIYISIKNKEQLIQENSIFAIDPDYFNILKKPTLNYSNNTISFTVADNKLILKIKQQQKVKFKFTEQEKLFILNSRNHMDNPINTLNFLEKEKKNLLFFFADGSESNYKIFKATLIYSLMQYVFDHLY